MGSPLTGPKSRWELRERRWQIERARELAGRGVGVPAICARVSLMGAPVGPDLVEAWIRRRGKR